jgi:hypothetical protein
MLHEIGIIKDYFRDSVAEDLTKVPDGRYRIPIAARICGVEIVGGKIRLTHGGPAT